MGSYASSTAGVDILELRTPGATLANMRTVDTMVTTLASDIMRQKGADSTLGKAFAPFAQEWKKFYADHKSGFGAWWSRGTSSVWNKVNDYRTIALKWIDKAKANGVTYGGVAAPKLTASVLSGWGKWILLGGVVGGWYLIRRLTK